MKKETACDCVAGGISSTLELLVDLLVRFAGLSASGELWACCRRSACSTGSRCGESSIVERARPAGKNFCAVVGERKAPEAPRKSGKLGWLLR